MESERLTIRRSRFCRWLGPLALFRIFLMLVMMPGFAFGHGVVGDRIFLSPIVGNDAFPDNALDLTMRRSNYEFSLLPTLEKQLSDNSSLFFVSSWHRVTPEAGQRTEEGFGDLSIYYCQGVFISVPHEMEITLSPFIVLPVGNRQIADQGYTHLGGELLLGKGLGDLSDRPSFKYLRPFALQAEGGYAGRVQGPANSDVFGNFEVEYSLEYLDHFVERIMVASTSTCLKYSVVVDRRRALDGRKTTTWDAPRHCGVRSDPL